MEYFHKDSNVTCIFGNTKYHKTEDVERDNIAVGSYLTQSIANIFGLYEPSEYELQELLKFDLRKLILLIQKKCRQLSTNHQCVEYVSTQESLIYFVSKK